MALRAVKIEDPVVFPSTQACPAHGDLIPEACNATQIGLPPAGARSAGVLSCLIYHRNGYNGVVGVRIHCNDRICRHFRNKLIL
jgi:hypothetical protein